MFDRKSGVSSSDLLKTKRKRKQNYVRVWLNRQKTRGKKEPFCYVKPAYALPSYRRIASHCDIKTINPIEIVLTQACSSSKWVSNVQGIHLELKILSILFHHFLRQFTITLLDVLQLLLVICNKQNSFFAKYQESFLTLLSWSNIFHNVCFPHQNKSPFNRASE